MKQRKQCGHFYSMFDLYGIPVRLNFRGEEFYTTWWGALISIVVVSLTLGFTGIFLSAIKSNSQQVVSTMVHVNKLQGDAGEHIKAGNVAFGIQSPFKAGQYSEENFGQWVVTQTVIQEILGGEDQYIKYTIGTHECGEDDWVDLSSYDQERYDENQRMWCLDNDALQKFQYSNLTMPKKEPKITIDFEVCNTGTFTDCFLPRTVQFEQWMAEASLVIYTQSQAIDYNKTVSETENAIVNTQEVSRIYFDLERATRYSIDVQSERLTDMVSLFESIPDIVTDFFSMKLTHKQEFIRDAWKSGKLVGFEQHLVKDLIEHKRWEPGFISFLGTVGGLIVFLSLMGYILVRLTTMKFRTWFFVKSRYNIQGAAQVVVNKLQRAQTLPSKVSPEPQRGGQVFFNKIHQMAKNTEIDNFKTIAASRRRFPVMCRVIFDRLWNCHQPTYQRLYAVAKDHLREEFDIETILRRIRTTQAAIWGLTTPNQRKLCRHQAVLLLHDMEDQDFNEYKLPAKARIEDAKIKGSSSSENPNNLDFVEEIRKKPSELDSKLISHYIETHTPRHQQLARKRAQFLQQKVLDKKEEQRAAGEEGINAWGMSGGKSKSELPIKKTFKDEEVPKPVNPNSNRMKKGQSDPPPSSQSTLFGLQLARAQQHHDQNNQGKETPLRRQNNHSKEETPMSLYDGSVTDLPRQHTQSRDYIPSPFKGSSRLGGLKVSTDEESPNLHQPVLTQRSDALHTDINALITELSCEESPAPGQYDSRAEGSKTLGASSGDFFQPYSVRGSKNPTEDVSRDYDRGQGGSHMMNQIRQSMRDADPSNPKNSLTKSRTLRRAGYE